MANNLLVYVKRGLIIGFFVLPVQLLLGPMFGLTIVDFSRLSGIAQYTLNDQLLYLSLLVFMTIFYGLMSTFVVENVE